MVTTAQNAWPPFDLDAAAQDCETRIYLGGPRPFIRRALVAEGLAPPTSASVTLNGAVVAGITTVWTLDDVSALLRPGGALFIEGPDSDVWITYQGVDTTANQIYGVSVIAGVTQTLPDEQVCSQWRDITSYVESLEMGFRREGKAFIWSASLTGVEWNSLVQYQDATILITKRYWNSTFGGDTDTPIVDDNHDKLADSGWTPFVPRFIGYLDPVKVSGDADGTSYTITARCESKYLSQMSVTPKTYGAETITGTRTASSTLGAPSAEPEEGDGVADFGPDQTGDDNRRTLWISQNAPSTSSALALRPTGRVQNTTTIPESSGLGLRIQQVFCSGVETARMTRQRQTWIEVANTNPEPPALWPFEDDISAKGGPIPAKDDGLTFGNISLTGIALRNSRNQRLYLSSKNGYGLGDIILGRGTTGVLTFDKAVFDDLLEPPEDTEVVEYQQCDGWRPGLDPNVGHRGVGSEFYLDPAGDWLALEAAVAGNPRFEQYQGGPNPTVSYDGCSPATGAGTITLSSVAGLPSSGYLISDGQPYRFYYSGISGSTLTGVQKFANYYPDGRYKDGFNVLSNGTGVKQGEFKSVWIDFVAWGTATVPSRFPSDLAPSSEDQNDNGVEAQRVWGWRGSDGYSAGFSQSGMQNVAPNGIGSNQSIRRKNANGGGVYQGNLGDGAFSNHDGATALDWTTLDVPLIGNLGPDASTEWLQIDLGEHAAATVVEDNSDVNDADGTITVGAGEANEYEISLRPDMVMRAGATGVEFRYTHHDGTTFFGVTKVRGAGAEIPNGTELVTLIDTNPHHVTANGARPRMEPYNLQSVSQLELRRWYDPPTVTITTAVTPTYAATAVVPVTNGGTRFFPAAGTVGITLSFPPVGGGLVPEVFGFPTALSYTGKTADTLTGVRFVSSSGTATLPVGTVLTLQKEVSYPGHIMILGSRREFPNDALTYLGSNPDWDIIRENSAPANAFQVYPVTTPNPYYRHIRVLVKQMKRAGANVVERAKINSFNIYRKPRYNPANLLPSSDQSSAPRGGVIAQSQVFDYYSSFTMANIVDDILASCGYDPDRRSCLGGPSVVKLALHSAPAWQTLSDLATRSGCVISDGPLGGVTWRWDRITPGASFPRVPVATIARAAIWGQVQQVELPAHQVGQIALEARNPSAEEVIAVQVPVVPLPLGDVVPVRDRFASTVAHATNIAKQLLIDGNGGRQWTVPIGNADYFQPQDLVRLDLSIDAAGLQGPVLALVIGMTVKSDAMGQQTTLTIEEYRTR